MRRGLGINLVIVLVIARVSPAMAAPVCLDTYRIQNTSIPNAKTIVFHMKDGSVWENTLKNACPDLRFWGFVYVDRGGLNKICDNVDAVRVINSGEICMLGTFRKEPSQPPRP